MTVAARDDGDAHNLVRADRIGGLEAGAARRRRRRARQDQRPRSVAVCAGRQHRDGRDPGRDARHLEDFRVDQQELADRWTQPVSSQHGDAALGGGHVLAQRRFERCRVGEGVALRRERWDLLDGLGLRSSV